MSTANLLAILEELHDSERFEMPRPGKEKDEIYDRLYLKQAGQCAICRCTPADPRNRKKGEQQARFDMDHDHRTGEVRGLLCSACNLGLGKFGDDLATVRRAGEYLERSGQSE